MKKIVAMLLMISIFLLGNAAFAENTTTTGTKGKAVQRLQDQKGRGAEVKPLIEKIRSNKAEILQLRADARSSYEKTKNKVKALMKNKENLTQQQIEALKQAVATLGQDKKVLANTLGSIQKESMDLKEAKRGRDLEAYKQSLNKILDVQNIRIEGLKKVIEDMSKIAGI